MQPTKTILLCTTISQVRHKEANALLGELYLEMARVGFDIAGTGLGGFSEVYSITPKPWRDGIILLYAKLPDEPHDIPIVTPKGSKLIPVICIAPLDHRPAHERASKRLCLGLSPGQRYVFVPLESGLSPVEYQQVAESICKTLTELTA